MSHILLSICTVVVLLFNRANTALTQSPNKVLSEATYSLLDRYEDPYVNSVFSDNILLTLAYMSGKVKKGDKIPWNIVDAPSVTVLKLKPGEIFAFHDNVLSKYKGKVVSTTNAHFNSSEGFKSDGWLIGDGVCHLASFMHAVSVSAGLLSEAPTKHDFAKIADVPEQYGVSIYYSPNDSATSMIQNLYITNNRSKTIAYVFTQKNDLLNIRVEEIN